MAGIKISIVDDVASFLRGAGKAEDALDKVADSLDDVARDAQTAGRDAGTDLAKGVDRGTDRATDSVEKLERSFRDMADDASKYAKRAGDDIGDNVKKGTRDAEDGMKEFGDEANSTAREAAASFDGSAESIADAFQEVAANAFAGFGPAGAAAGLAVAAGLGTFVTSWNENTEAAKARISGMADAMIEANSRVLAQDYINEQLRMIYTGADDAAVKLKDLRQMSEDTGIAESQLARAFAGDQDARVDALNRVRTATEEAFQDTFSMDQEQVDSATKRQAEIGRWIDDLEKLGGQYDTAASDLAGYTSAVAAGHDTATGRVHSTIEAYESLHRTITSMPASTTTTTTVKVVPDTRELDRVLGTLRTVPVNFAVRGGSAVG